MNALIRSPPAAPKRPGNRLKWTPEMLAELDRCLRAGSSNPETARRCGCHPHALANGLRQLIAVRYPAVRWAAPRPGSRRGAAP